MSTFSSGIKIADMDVAQAKMDNIVQLCEETSKAVSAFVESAKELDGLLGNNLSEVVEFFEGIEADCKVMMAPDGSVDILKQMWALLCNELNDTQNERIHI